MNNPLRLVKYDTYVVLPQIFCHIRIVLAYFGQCFTGKQITIGELYKKFCRFVGHQIFIHTKNIQLAGIFIELCFRRERFPVVKNTQLLENNMRKYICM